MQKKKSAPKKKVPAASPLRAIGETIGSIAGTIVKEKNHLAEMAGSAIESVKTTVQEFTATKKPVVKKAVKKAVKNVAKKVAKKATAVVKKESKAAPIKKVAKTAIAKKAGKKK